VGLIPAARYIKGNVIAENADGSYTVATSDGATIRARAQSEQAWSVGMGVFIQEARIVDSSPNLFGLTQFV
jgi:hypothetical protein